MRLPIAFGMMFVCCLGLGCSRSPSTPSSARLSPSPQHILATIGDQSITLAAFRKQYKAAGKGYTPAQFLQKLIEQELLFLESRQRGLGRSEAVVGLTRRAIAQIALKRGFERWFRPESIGLLQVRKEYQSALRWYVRPRLLYAWHILARFPTPTHNSKQLSDALRNQQEAMIKEGRRQALVIANQALKLVRKASPTTAKAFSAAVAPLIRTYNTPDPRVVAWGEQTIAALRQRRPANGQAIIDVLQAALASLDQLVVCDVCRTTRYYTNKIKKSWKPRAAVSASALDDIARKIKQHASFPRDRLRARNLSVRGAFSYEDMLESFSKAAFALRDGQYTKSLVSTKFGYHIIFLERSTKPKHVTFRQALPDLRKQLYLRQRPAQFARWMQLRYQQTKTLRYLNRLK